MSESVTNQQVWQAIQELTPEQIPIALQAIQAIGAAKPKMQSGLVTVGTDLRGSDLIGIWSDRVDVSTAEFARRLRSQAESRQGTADAT